MKYILKRALATLTISAALITTSSVYATNGYFKIGYGAKNRGLAGTGMALGQDALAPAINPATLAGMGNRWDAGIEFFNPQREAAIDGRGIGGGNAQADSGATVFAIPNFGSSYDLGNGITLGLTMVANGGMSTRYNSNLYTNAFGPAIPGFAGLLISQGADPATVGKNAAALGSDPNLNPSLGINLAQLLITPTIAYKINDNHSVGFAPVIGYQQFRAYGLGLFKGLSDSPDKLTNNGNDDAWGLGARAGYQGNFGMFSFGASYTSKIYMQEFDDYAGLFAEQGDFDIPATYGAGLAIRFTDKVTLAADITTIKYGDVDAIANSGPTANELLGGFSNALLTGDGSNIQRSMGSDNGFGFGWDDITVYKVGMNYDYSPQWSFRSGFNYAEVPYDDDQSLFNVLAPAVVEKHLTAGFSYRPSTDSEISMTYMRAFRNDTDSDYAGSGPFNGFGYSARNAMSQNAIEVSYGASF